ncbi:hypothetical protein [Nonomuraea sp. NPDC049480]|uniref:cation transporter dimerization domain-containing protein n=1 Tax=Nonomuraea sp. NPDC049480 TaxID=3364353 RepID=UPI0037BA5BA9
MHDLHVWEVTSGYAALSAHILVTPGADCRAVRQATERMLHETYGISHTHSPSRPRTAGADHHR